ncbi:MAG: hypothetical protein V3U29_08820 [Phycisphaeraceae bacterium]
MNQTPNPCDPGTEPATARSATRRGGVRRLLVRASLLCVALLCVAGGVGYWLWQSEPAYVTRTRALLQSKSHGELEQMASSLENRIVSELTSISPTSGTGSSTHSNAAVTATLESRITGDAGDVRTISVSLDEVNAWMAVKLNAWLANQHKTLPDEITEPMVAVRDDKLVLAFRYVSDRLDQVVSLDFTVELQDGQEATIKLLGIRGGKLPLPAGTAAKLMPKTADSDQQGVIEKLAKAFDGMSFDPVANIDASRKARVIGLALRPDGLDVTVRVESRYADGRQP